MGIMVVLPMGTGGSGSWVLDGVPPGTEAGVDDLGVLWVELGLVVVDGVVVVVGDGVVVVVVVVGVVVVARVVVVVALVVVVVGGVVVVVGLVVVVCVVVVVALVVVVVVDGAWVGVVIGVLAVELSIRLHSTFTSGSSSYRPGTKYSDYNRWLFTLCKNRHNKPNIFFKNFIPERDDTVENLNGLYINAQIILRWCDLWRDPNRYTHMLYMWTHTHTHSHTHTQMFDLLNHFLNEWAF